MDGCVVVHELFTTHPIQRTLHIFSLLQRTVSEVDNDLTKLLRIQYRKGNIALSERSWSPSLASTFGIEQGGVEDDGMC